MVGSSWAIFLAGFATGIAIGWVYHRRLRAKLKLMEFYLGSRIEGQSGQRLGVTRG